MGPRAPEPGMAPRYPSLRAREVAKTGESRPAAWPALAVSCSVEQSPGLGFLKSQPGSV
eukprot:CAMPEP_0119528066 /NCGR_PEP_ID=MMETSP1344-20130328/42351_1 /TAXON_ID=236787 /ORGANISM="Florenciella parvula, Strain CCMP2471" /LENGTH=58 /DNA_ID=CAMNT_0007567379 /DNA_START=75 /DNA_END=247 /DNA_ORIENTATION=+